MIVKLKKSLQLIGVILIGILLVWTAIGFARGTAVSVVAAGPLPPPEGYPKLSLSTKMVTPTLAYTDGAVLEYSINILNTGAYTAMDVILSDVIPVSTTYITDSAWSSAPPTPVFTNGAVLWEHGQVGFDASVEIRFSVTVSPGLEGIIYNTAVISDPMLTEPVTVTAEAHITDNPLFEISKSATPALPGKEKPLTYELVVTNMGQATGADFPIVITDFIPTDTTFLGASPGFVYDPVGDAVMWDTSVNLGFGESSVYTFSVQVGDVASGTVIANNDYFVVSEDRFSIGEPYTTTVVDPIFILSKGIYPDPPGSNREMTYTLTLLNLGSLATDLVITDTVPPELEYVRGGDAYDPATRIVTWYLDSLDTRQSAQLTFTVYINDIAGIIVINGDYSVCSGEGVCAPGIPVPSFLVGTNFAVTAELYPIAHKPGGGDDTVVTPTLTVQNIGPGNATDVQALFQFGRMSISNVDKLRVIPPVGVLSDGPDCGDKCVNYVWFGDLAMGEMITVTTISGTSTIGGEEWTPYTATVVVTDTFSGGGYTTDPITATAVGHVTHMSNLIPTKTAPALIGAGQSFTYTIEVFDSGLSTEEPPVLTDTLPLSVTLVDGSISDGGTFFDVGGRTVISWTLPEMGPGDSLYRSFAVQVDPTLVSGTLIVNDQYQTSVYESYIHDIKVVPGVPVTTTVHEVGLIDSYKTVSPTWALPGTGTVLTYVVHVVNSSPNDLAGVQVSDIFPWQDTTYQRDAVASSGTLVSDIISLEWTGDVAANSHELITFTVVVDDFFEGVVTNTATISHESMIQEKVATAVAYITDKPVLRISKTASPDPVNVLGTLLYRVHVSNLGAQATLLEVTDTIPLMTTYITGTASSGGMQVGDLVRWFLPVLEPATSVDLTFQVTVRGGKEVINAQYGVCSDEGVCAYGDPVITPVKYLVHKVLLPFTFRY